MSGKNNTLFPKIQKKNLLAVPIPASPPGTVDDDDEVCTNVLMYQCANVSMYPFHRGTYVHVKEEEQTKLEDINEEEPIPASTTGSVGVDNKVCAFSKYADSNAKKSGRRAPSQSGGY